MLWLYPTQRSIGMNDIEYIQCYNRNMSHINMNLIELDPELYDSYMRLGVNECYSSKEYVKLIVDMFPQHELTIIYKTVE